MKKRHPYKSKVPRMTWGINPKSRIKDNKKFAAKNSEEDYICILNKNKYCDECGECEDGRI